MAKRTAITSGKGEIILYRAPDGRAALDVRFEEDTLWLTQQQIAELFVTERSVITKHLRNIFNSGELDEKRNVQKMHIPGSDKPVAFHNLDVILSVGYRVNSKRGTQFRIWATAVLREHLVKGYSVNERRLRELNQAVRLITDLAGRRELTGDEAAGLLRVVGDYSYALELLDDYDHQRVKTGAVSTAEALFIKYDEARRIVERLHQEFGASSLFGQEKDESLRGALGAIHQTFEPSGSRTTLWWR